MAPRKKRSIPALEDFPKPLRMAIARVMAGFDIDYPEALERAALLMDINRRVFTEAVDREAESRYKSRFMSQLNKARATIMVEYEGRIEASHWNGYGKGIKEGKENYGVWYHCNVCNQIIYITPNSEPHRLVNEFLQSRGWGHKSCHEKRAQGS